jgi:thiol-disulfide isomerase/thioredoxin
VPVAAPLKDNRGPTKVFDLRTEAEAEEFVAGDKGVLMVYAPWCGHCKNMMPAYDSASLKTPVKFARLEGSNAPAFMAKHQIRGFPTILSVKDKIISRYNSGRDEASLLAHASSL